MESKSLAPKPNHRGIEPNKTFPEQIRLAIYLRVELNNGKMIAYRLQGFEQSFESVRVASNELRNAIVSFCP